MELEGKRIAALGLAFKPNVDDLRESPAIEVAKLLAQAGAQVKSYEPYAPGVKISSIRNVPGLVDAIADADLLLLLVGHKEFKELDPKKIHDLTPSRLVVDAVGGWNPEAWKQAGFKFFRLGVGDCQ
jgi:UDP-N-acetyl-D-mannosaminuronic acid dehydrogenase